MSEAWPEALQAARAAVDADWSSTDAHRELVQRASQLGLYAPVARYYRQAKADPARAEVATAQLARIEKMAVAAILTQPIGERVAARGSRYRGVTLVIIALVVVVLIGLFAATRIRHQAATKAKPPARMILPNADK